MRWLAFLFLLATGASAQEQLLRQISDTKSNSSVEITALFSTPAPRGYLPVKVTIDNRLEGNRSIKVSFTSTVGYGDGAKMSSSFSLDGPGEKATEHDLLVPLVTLVASGYSSGVSLDVQLSGSMGSARGAIGADYAPDQPAVLMSEKLFTPNASALDAAAGSRFSSYRGGVKFAGKFTAPMMPSDWRAYSGYDALLITAEEWTAASPSARNAVQAWVRLGGRLVIYSEGGSSAGLNLPTDTSFGSISIQSLASGSTTLDPAATVKLVQTGGASIQSKSISEDYSSSWPLQDAFGKVGFNYGVFITVLIAFGVLVGPVNLFVFAKSGRRHRLFITTPLISLGASLVLIAMILLQDGFGGRGTRVILMEVRPDNDENAAYVHQEQFSRTGVLTGAGFTLQEAAAMSPVPIAANNRWARFTHADSGNGSVYSADFEDGKLATKGDWFQSRSEQGHVLTAVIPTRGRIERTSRDGSPQLLSTFDFPIDTLFYLDTSNQWWRADQISTGTRFEPVPVSASIVTSALAAERNRLGSRHREMFQRASKRPGCFIAITNSAPGIDTYMSIKWQETRTLITGPIVNP